MPVLDVIHSSEVSTIFSRSELESMVSGTEEPVPIIFAYFNLEFLSEVVSAIIV